MHRLNLRFATPTKEWNKNLPENELFMNAWNEQNKVNSEALLSMLDCEAEKNIAICNTLMIDQLNTVRQYLEEDRQETRVEELFLLQNIILRASKGSDTLRNALKMRGQFNFFRGRFEAAEKDFTMFLHINTRFDCAEEMCEIHGALLIAHYVMRHYEEAANYLRFYNEYKAKLPKDRFIGTTLEQISTKISSFESDMRETDNTIQKSVACMPFEQPFKGFNIKSGMRCLSAACLYIPVCKQDNQQDLSGIYADCDIPKGRTVLLEKPLSCIVGLPLAQCELCLLHVDQVFSCLNCRYKFYCSLTCMEKDKVRHDYECACYKTLLIFILDAKDVFNIFLSISMFLDEHIFNKKTFCKITTAADILSKVEKLIGLDEMEERPFLKLLRTKPNYYNLTNSQYCTLVVTAFRLTLFIQKSTTIVNKFFKKLKLTADEKAILIGSLLMRIHAYLLLNTLDFEYGYSNNESKEPDLKLKDEMVGPVLQPVRNIIKARTHSKSADAQILGLSERFSQLELKEKEFENEHSLIQKTLCEPICRPICVLKIKLAAMSLSSDKNTNYLYGRGVDTATTEKVCRFLCYRVAKMNDEDSVAFARSFVQDFHIHFFQYFLTLINQPEGYHQVLSLLCPNLRKFQHSCVPNVEVRLLENGFVVGQTVRKIEEGEELVVSYKANSQ